MRHRPEQVSLDLPDGDASADELQELLLDLVGLTGIGLDDDAPVNVTFEFSDPDSLSSRFPWGDWKSYYRKASGTYFYTIKMTRQTFISDTEGGADLSTIVMKWLEIDEQAYEYAGVVKVHISNGK